MEDILLFLKMTKFLTINKIWGFKLVSIISYSCFHIQIAMENLKFPEDFDSFTDEVIYIIKAIAFDKQKIYTKFLFAISILLLHNFGFQDRFIIVDNIGKGGFELF